MESQLLEQLVQNQKLLTQMVTKDAVGTPSFTPLHGLGGIFSGAGVEREVITAYVTPEGLGAKLRRVPSVYEDPRFSSLTGYTATTGTRPTSSCADATKGYVKSCELTALFGLNRQDSQEIEMDKVMLRVNRGDHTDLRLMGEVLGNTGFSPSGLNQSQIVQIVTMSEMVGMAVQLEREMATDLWMGNIVVNSFPGLDYQIATGQLDARTGNACPALDSDVKEFAYSSVDGTDKDIVEYLSMLAWYLKHNATRMRLMPVQWAVVMRPELWFELSAVWPCSYLTHRCANSAGTAVSVINDNTNVRMRDDMRTGMYIDINGLRYPVIIDDGIYEANSVNDSTHLVSGEYASSIYIVPITIRGGFPVCYMEYLDYRQASLDTALLRGKESYWHTDNGMYSWSITDKKGWCYQLHLKTEQRVVLRTPQLAGKLQKVKYSPLQHLRSPFADSAYFLDGGVSTAPTGTRYAAWMPQGGR